MMEYNKFSKKSTLIGDITAFVPIQQGENTPDNMVVGYKEELLAHWQLNEKANFISKMIEELQHDR